jgi:hypothetical protein
MQATLMELNALEDLIPASNGMMEDAIPSREIHFILLSLALWLKPISKMTMTDKGSPVDVVHANFAARKKFGVSGSLSFMSNG